MSDGSKTEASRLQTERIHHKIIYTRQKNRDLDEGGVFKDLVGVTNELQLLHGADRGIQIQNYSCGRNTETGLSKENRFKNKGKDGGSSRSVCKGAAPLLQKNLRYFL